MESNVLRPRAAGINLEVICKRMRIHKITIQAMWIIIMPQLLDHISRQNPDLMTENNLIKDGGNIEKLVTLLGTDKFREVVERFVNLKDNLNFKFWWGYIQMVQILLLFTRAHRDGNWELHLYVFQAMLPYFMRYNRTNYARLGTIYISEMHPLPADVLQEFQS